MNEIIQLDSIKTYNEMYGLPTKHPLVAVIDLKQAKRLINHVKLNYGVYALFIKHGIGCTLRYGRQSYDYQKGTVVTLAPGQAVEVDMNPNQMSNDVTGLIFHPDLIFGTPLAEKMNKYTYFNYGQREALHVSERELSILTECLHQIDAETDYPVDTHSRQLLCTYIDLFLEYCLRAYDRQFITRNKVNSDILSQFEHELNGYFQNGRIQSLPSVKYFADKACLSPSYFGDLIKKETGKTAQEYIHMKIINQSKQLLLGTNQSISQIADTLGFQYPQHFVRMFKKQTGHTPREYRGFSS